MKKKFNSFSDGEKINYIFDYQTLNSLNKSSDIKSIDDVNITIHVLKFDSYITLKFKGEIDLTLISAYSFKPFKNLVKIDDEILKFTNIKEYENEEVIYLKDIIDLDEIIYSLIVINLPLNPHKDDESLDDIEGIHVYSEDEAEKERANNSPFSKLKDMDFDD